MTNIKTENEMTVAEYINLATYDRDGQIIFSKHGDDLQMLLDVRGWGHLQNVFSHDLSKAALFQDLIGEFVTQAINEKIERELGCKQQKS